MKKIISILVLGLFGSAFGYSEYAVLLKDGFGGYDNALMITRESKSSDYQYYVVNYGIGCGLGMWRYEGGKVVVNTGKYGTFLDGISDYLILPKKTDYGTTYSCRIWSVENLSDLIDTLDEDDLKWLYDNDILSD